MFYQEKVIHIIIFSLISLSFCLRSINSIIYEEVSQKEQEYIKPPEFSNISGFYPENFKLKIFSEENTTIYYTIDSTDPKSSPTSKIFKDYILIYDRSSEENIYSSINSTNDSPTSINAGYDYFGPIYPVDKAMIIRAVSKNSKGEFSEIITKTYFITNDILSQYNDLTVTSIVTNPENLFDPDIGIYVTGTMYQNWIKSGEYDPLIKPWDEESKTNYYMKGKDWEREASVTIFDKGEIIVEQNMGIRIKGGSTRNNPAKSFNLYSRNKYGKPSIEAKLFKDNYDKNGNLITRYKSLSLRAVDESGRIKEIFGRDLFYLRKGLTSTNMKIAVLFLNGEYWGVYIVQEKFSKYFFENKYLISKENVSFVKDNQIEEGPVKELEDFKNFCEEYTEKDLSNEKIYKEIKKYIDLDSMIELFATGIYISNMDWPYLNDGEWRYIGEKEEKNQFTDGKWRFVIFDLDYSMGAKYHGMGAPGIDNFSYANRRNIESPVNLFFALLKNNKDFQNTFINIYCDYANDIYNMNKINQLIEKYKEDYTEMIAYSELRWWGWTFDSKLEGYSSCKLNYLKVLDSLLDFFQQRPNFTFNHMKEFLKLNEDLVDLNIEIKGKGKIQINTIIPEFNKKKWKGKYFSGIPISLKAIPDEGNNFKKWDGDFQYIENNIEISLLNSTNIIAIFE